MWSFAEFVSNIVYELGYVFICVVLGVHRLRVVFKSDFSSLSLPYNEGASHRCNL
jgi:hypothetical protein